MKNRSIMLLALLAANDRLGPMPIHRTMLVKQAFLAETIRPLYHIWQKTFGFVRYYYGPYADDIFERLDTLIFNGLVTVTTIERRRGKFEARYQITESGHQILNTLDVAQISKLALDLVWALQAIGVRQAATICKLVYQEAEFARVFAKQTQDSTSAEMKVPLPSITSADNKTFTMLSTLEELRKPQGEQDTKSIPMREVLRIFLLCLAHEIPSGSLLSGSAT